MGTRIRGVLIVAVVLVTGAFLGSALSQWWATPDSIPAVPGSFHRFGVNERVRVEVLNGGGKTGMARSATESLRGEGFDVVNYDNAEEPRDSSVVLARTGEVAFARAVADALGIREVRLQPDSNLFLDVTVVLGGEWEPLAVETAAQEERAWWDPRGWLKRPGSPEQNERLVDPGEEGSENQ